MEAELSGIVLQTLEARGVLGKIRAELRANVFSAIHEQRGIASDRPNPSLAALRANDGAGRVAAGLLRELLRSCELDYSAAVLLPEAGIAEGPTDRASLAAELGLAAGGDEPLLVQLVRAQLGGGGAAPAPSPSRAPLAGRHAPPAVAKQPSPPRGFVDDVVPGKRAAAKQPSPPRGAWGDSGDAEAEAERRLDAIEKKMAGLAGMAGRAPAAAKPAGGFRGDFEDDLDAEDLDEVDEDIDDFEADEFEDSTERAAATSSGSAGYARSAAAMRAMEESLDESVSMSPSRFARVTKGFDHQEDVEPPLRR